MPQQSSIPAQQQGQYMSVPQQAMTRDEQGQDIPLQNRMPSPMTSHGTPNEKGQGPEQAGTSQQQGNHGIQEFYTPGGANN